MNHYLQVKNLAKEIKQDFPSVESEKIMLIAAQIYESQLSYERNSILSKIASVMGADDASQKKQNVLTKLGNIIDAIYEPK